MPPCRGVTIRILQSPGFSGQKQESDTLREEFPDRVSIRSIEMGKWYGGGGIMHQKIWVFDSRHVYVGSANMDWKSISQVKEMGIAVEDCPDLAADAGCYFESWWCFSALTPACVETFDPVARIDRTVPRWSNLVPVAQRAPSPLGGEQYAATSGLESPLPLELNGELGSAFLTGCPNEVMGSGRTWDGDGLVHTINDARKSVCVSVMDFAPTSLFGRAEPRVAERP